MPSNFIPYFTCVATCPRCGGQLRLRHRRADQAPFVGCERFPLCAFTAPYDHVIEHLGSRLKAAEARARVPALCPEMLDRELRKLMATVHPDLWGDHPLATELAKAVNNLRTKIRGETLP